MDDRVRKLARAHSATHRRGATPTPLDRLDSLETVLRKARASFLAAGQEDEALSGVGEWLLDNFYVVQRAIRQVEENMPPGYYRRLPKLDGGALEGHARVYALAREVIILAQGGLDVQQVRSFLETYQSVRSLTMGELWAVPTMLRLGLLEALARTVSRAAEFGWRKDPDLPELPDLGERREEVQVASAINSLRAVDSQDWDVFFESVSLVERTLRSDPAEVYAQMDFDTRDQYRGVVEDLARGVDGSELEVARAAIALATEGPGAMAAAGEDAPAWGERAEHVGFYLIGRGHGVLEEAIGYERSLAERIRGWILEHATSVYLGGIAFTSILALSAGVAYVETAGAGLAMSLLTAGLLLIPASVVGVSLVNLAVTRGLPSHVLPKLDLRDGIPREWRTMVVVPALLTSDDEIDFLLRQLELHYLGNGGEHVGFAVLSDFADAPEKRMPDDEALLERAVEGIQQLNRQYARDGEGQEGDPGPFYLFHRERLWNPGEGCWMGWERKRGKLAEFNRLLRGEADTSYAVTVGDLAFLPEVQYVITLDADTVFPMDSAHRLVGTLAHPLNRPLFQELSEKDSRDVVPPRERVVAGYTVLQPRTEVKPTAVTQTRFTRIFAGDAGLDLYTRAVSDVYQDLFGEGVYTGKGIYDVDAFERSLRECVPENALLSHDLFEGVHGRAGLVSDVVVFEDYPPTYLSYAHRLHRWVRGDWQILPWLLSKVPWAGEGRVSNKLSTLDRWKILDNLRRSLRGPAMLLLLVAGWLCLPGSSLVWMLITLAIAGLPVVTGFVTELSRRLQGGRDVGWGARLRTEASRWLLRMVFLPYESLLMLDAIGTTLVRLTVSRRRLLQWTTAAHTVRVLGKESRIRLLWRRMGAGPAVGLAVAGALAWARPQVLPAAAPVLVAWVVSPQIAAWISRCVERDRAELPSGERRRLRRLARRTWLYFERFVGPDDHWLPPDHFQETPRGSVAHRTSPTNIGLLLLSTLSAWDMGYVGVMDLMLRLSEAFDGMGDLERYRGHFLNWYSTTELRTLEPAYVSTVDSGNLAACLIALRQGLLEVQGQPVLRWERWRGLCDTVGVLGEVVSAFEGQEEVAEEAKAVEEQTADLCQRIAEARDHPSQWVSVLDAVEGEIRGVFRQKLEALLDAGGGVLGGSTLRDLRLWSERVSMHVRDTRREIDRLLPWVEMLEDLPALLSGNSAVEEAEQTTDRIRDHEAWQGLQSALGSIPRLEELGEVCQAARSHLDELRPVLEEEAVDPGTPEELREQLVRAREWCRELDNVLEEAAMAAGSMMVNLNEQVERAEDFVRKMDFAFLYDEEKDVFHIGYQVRAEALDANHYDLLASEARIASMVALAKGDIPQRHWLHLDRPLTSVDGLRALLSWGGSMFEYLMPSLLMREYQETLLEQSNRACVQEQIVYAARKGVPWGISESGYYRLDAQMNYQYQSFGVPCLGRKRGLAGDLVIAPYASMLAVGIRPESVLENFERLVDLGMLGHYGLYEAVDFTQPRLPTGDKRAIVRSYMAHHQGMTMIALANHLGGDESVERFHRDPRIESVEFLLQEQIPHEAPLERRSEESLGVEPRERERVTLEPWSVVTDAPLPQSLLLSNGRYTLLITEAGAGYSAFASGPSEEGEPTALTRWRADTTLDTWGTWIYVQDVETGSLYSATSLPAGGGSNEDEVQFYPHQATFRRRYGGVSVYTEVTVAPDDDVEIRRVTVTNHSGEERSLRISSYSEVVLSSQDQDRRHPAFNKLFVESEYVEAVGGLLFSRRPRSAEEEPLYMAHGLLPPRDGNQEVVYETDRRAFLGRGQTTRYPLALSSAEEASSGAEADGRWLSGTTGATLDPVMALGQEIEVDPHGTVQLAYLTVAAEKRDEAVALLDRYRAWARIDRAFEQAHARSEVELRNRELEVHDVRVFSQLLSGLLYPHGSLRAEEGKLEANRRGQAGLWSLGISGDYPILLLRISEEEGLSVVREVLRAHAYWRDRQTKIDVVILNDRDVGYAQPLSERLHRLIRQMDADPWLDRRGGLFLVNGEQLEKGNRVLLETAARVVLDADRGSLDNQIESALWRPSRLPSLTPTRAVDADEETAPVTRPDELLFDNGYGGFSPEGDEYLVFLPSGGREGGDAAWTPAPWVNVIANPSFGCLVSEAGLGYSWAGNSGENRLTPWRNDPVSDTPAEAIYLRDEETGGVWTPTPLPTGEDAPYLVRHGAGYSIFQHNSHGLEQRLRVFTAPKEPVKVIQLRLENVWDRPRRITATYFAEWVLGVHRDHAQQYVVSSYDGQASAMLARNSYSAEFGERVAFLAVDREPHSVTADRTEFLGRLGDWRHPAALGRVGLESAVGPGLDPCAALQVHLDLAAGETKEVSFVLGQGEDESAALDLVKRYQLGERVSETWEEVQDWWDGLLGTVRVETPDPGMDLLLNRWLLYQALACRLWARSALYQSSGAYGFRDQLQDVMALLHAAPETAREHVLRSARHQFEEGDVLHWWHPPSGCGVRTRISDDLLWLPYVTAEYVDATGDVGILDEMVPFRLGKPLRAEEEERYGHYELSEEGASLYEHCLRALEKGSTAGAHGLPLIGTGDWNDGLNRVGVDGQGESVWLGWFLYENLLRFASVCEKRDDTERARAYQEQAKELGEALEESAWDGEWYIRAMYDDGTPLGAADNEECQIASMAQSWAVLSGAANEERRERAMDAVVDWLVDETDDGTGLVRLFTPPFDETPRDPGYIKGYPPGIRENGGQYTHAALWAVWAFTELGEGQRAGELFRLLNPVYHSDALEKARRFRVEPYVVAADVYSADRFYGMGGWTWYTGSSGWMYRLGVEAILGMHREGDVLRIAPCIPDDWTEYQVRYRYGGTTYEIEVANPEEVCCRVEKTTVDGEEQAGNRVPLKDDGETHHVLVTMGRPGGEDGENG